MLFIFGDGKMGLSKVRVLMLCIGPQNGSG